MSKSSFYNRSSKTKKNQPKLPDNFDYIVLHSQGPNTDDDEPLTEEKVESETETQQTDQTQQDETEDETLKSISSQDLNYLSTTASILLGFIILTILANVTTITLASLTIETANNIFSIKDTMIANIEFNNINQDSPCLNCQPTSGFEDDFTATITGVMNNDIISQTPNLIQFYPNGIEIDNILFSTEDVSSANSFTNILFENDVGASQNLFATVPGFITIPQTSMSAVQLNQYCSSITGVQIMFSNYYANAFQVCICNNLGPSCINLV